MTREQFYKVLYFILNAHEDTMNCDRCNVQLACLAEQVAAGADMHTLWPAVEGHLNCCPDCREEFDALLAIIRAENSGMIADQP